MYAHQTVMLQEAVAALAIQTAGIYVDATFGRGGHTRLILESLGASGHLIICDQDQAAIEVATKEWGQDARVSILHCNFADLSQALKERGLWGRINGILFDLGISSPQVDEGERGFSFLRAGPLDMRMDQTQGESLAAKLQMVTEAELSRILRDYGEEKFAHKISRAILAKREQLKTTTDLANLIAETMPKKFHERHKHPATRSFQALRIWVNGELERLEQALAFFPDLLAVGGRAVFISFHSLEDRLVKERMRFLSTPPQHPRGLPIQSDADDSPPMQICIKMQKPTAAEIENNPRARSSVLRVMERVK